MSSAKRVSRLPLRVALKRSIVASVAAFALLMGVLSVRMAMGNDPELGPKLAAGKQPAPALSEQVEPEDGSGVVIVAPQSSTPAPVTQPAPAPAPVQTTTS